MKRQINRWLIGVHERMCWRGWHWPIEWSEYAYPGSWDPPEPPEAGYACFYCGHVHDPYHWRLLAPWWDLKARYYDARRGSG
jgi:hypothetical protein